MGKSSSTWSIEVSTNFFLLAHPHPRLLGGVRYWSLTSRSSS